MSAWPSPPCHKNCQCFFVHRHCPIWVKECSCDTHTEETGSWCQWFKKFQTSLKSPIRFEDTRGSISSSNAVSSVRKQLTRNLTVCVQKISQNRNCCFECTRRHPYKVWSETCVNTCTVGSECCFWHPWPCHPIKTTWEHFWISELALSWFESYLSDRTQSVVVDGLMSTAIPFVFGVPQWIGPRTCTIHPVFTTPVWCHSMSQLWLSQVRWWHIHLWQCTT